MAKKPSKTLISDDAVFDLVGDSLEDARKDVLGTASEAAVTHLISSGVAALDNAIGGGIPYGTWACIAGPEKSGKSLLVTTMAGSFLRNGMPRLIYFDAEGSQEIGWMKTALGNPDKQSYFGVRNAKGGWKVRPRIDLNNIDVIEDAFDYMVNVLARIPDKRYDDHEDQWYLVIKNGDKNMDAYRKALGTPSRSKSTKTEAWYPVPHSAPQICWIADSWPLFNTNAEEEAGVVSKSISVMARAFSNHVGRVRGKIRRKAGIVLGVNQLREKPGVSYGIPYYEPGGTALQHVCSLRLWMFERSVPKEYRTPDMTSTAFIPEPSVEGDGEDHYQYKEVQIKKSKLRSAVSSSKTWIRVWVKDHKGYGRGIDPVFDVFQFLLDREYAVRADAKTNKAAGRNAVEFLPSKHPLSGKVLKWSVFKTLILAEVKPSPRLVKAAEKAWESLGVTPFGLRQWCFDHMPTPVPVTDTGELEDFADELAEDTSDDSEGEEPENDAPEDEDDSSATKTSDAGIDVDADDPWGEE